MNNGPEHSTGRRARTIPAAPACQAACARQAGMSFSAITGVLRVRPAGDMS